MAPPAAHLEKIRRLPIVEAVRGRLRLVKPIAQRRIRNKFVGKKAQRCQLFAARLGAAGRHHGRPVPLQHGFGAA